MNTGCILLSLVRDIYRKGIVDMAPLEENGKVPYHEITVVRGNLADNILLSELYTPKSAYEYVHG